jgi:hypothetical protein
MENKNIRIIIQTHELDDITSELLRLYYKTWFRKKYYKRLLNKIHKYCYPDDKRPLIE